MSSALTVALMFFAPILQAAEAPRPINEVPTITASIQPSADVRGWNAAMAQAKARALAAFPAVLAEAEAGGPAKLVETHYYLERYAGAADAWGLTMLQYGPGTISPEQYQRVAADSHASRVQQEELEKIYPALAYYSKNLAGRFGMWLDGRKPAGAPLPLADLVFKRTPTLEQLKEPLK